MNKPLYVLVHDHVVPYWKACRWMILLLRI